MWPEIMHISFYHRRAVYIHLLIDQADVISGNSDYSLYEVQPGIEWVMKNYDIPAFYLAIRQKLARKVTDAEVQFIHQQVVTGEKRIFHGLGRDLKCLDDERDDKDGNDDDH